MKVPMHELELKEQGAYIYTRRGVIMGFYGISAYLHYLQSQSHSNVVSDCIKPRTKVLFSDRWIVATATIWYMYVHVTVITNSTPPPHHHTLENIQNLLVKIDTIYPGIEICPLVQCSSMLLPSPNLQK